MGYISIQTVCLCCGLISIGHGLSFTCFWWVLKGLLVFGSRRAHYTTLGAVCHDNWAFLGQLTVLGDSWPGQICPLKCILGGASGFAVDLLYFVCNSTVWPLWFLILLYVGLDCLVWSSFVHGYVHVKGHPKVCQRISRCISWCISHRSA